MPLEPPVTISTFFTLERDGMVYFPASGKRRQHLPVLNF
jgi:hypothetical protein